MPQGQLSQSAYENISYGTRQKTAQCTENDGKDNIAQSHNASVLSTKTTVTPPSYYLTKYSVWRRALSQQCRANLAYIFTQKQTSNICRVIVLKNARDRT